MQKEKFVFVMCSQLFQIDIILYLTKSDRELLPDRTSNQFAIHHTHGACSK